MNLRRVLVAVTVASLALTSACTSSKPKATAPTSSARTAGTSPTSASPSAGPSGTGTGTGSTIPASITFSNCSGQFQTAIGTAAAKKMDFSCGRLPVPLSYANPSGATINIFVLKVHAKDQRAGDKVGSLLVNPGGPGESGINLAAGLVNALSSTVFGHFDLIGFDPRGVGLSSPLQCISDREKDTLVAADPDVRTAAGRAATKAASKQVATACATKYRTSLAHYNTAETAQDMDVIRRAVGDSKLNFLGFSYGTRLGAAYAHEFPTTIRTEVLDGALDPGTSTINFLDQQSKSLEQAFDQFSADCLKRPACAPLKNPRSVVTALVAAADKKPIPSSRKGETRKATGGIVTLAVTAALYNQDSWAALGTALVAARKGDSAGLFELSDSYLSRDQTTGHYTNVLDAETAINCNDSTFAISDAVVARTAATWIAKYPLFGKNSAATLYACYGWPPSGHTVPPASAPGAPPILVVGTTHDPITPFAQSTALAKALGTGIVLRWDGQGHTAYPKTSCIRTKVDDYLVTATPPAGDSCPAA